MTNGKYSVLVGTKSELDPFHPPVRGHHSSYDILCLSSSPLEYPPGRDVTVPSNSHMATAGGASALASGLNSTPSSMARSPMSLRSGGLVSDSRSSRATI